MAAFKVGQRVRIVHQVPASIAAYGDFRGREGTITRIGEGVFKDTECTVAVDGDTGEWETPFYAIAPLTDPGAESFIARIKKLGSEPVNDAPKVTAREGK